MLKELDQTGKRLVELRRRLSARKGVAGYEKTCEEMEREIARLENKTRAAKSTDTPAAKDIGESSASTMPA
jgi:hypothetical protein